MKKGRKISWKLLSALFAVMAGVVYCVFLGSRQERHQVVGKVTEGYRYRFQLSDSWQADEGYLYSRDADTGSFNTLHASVFKLRPSPLMQWSYRNLLHRPLPASAEIRLTTYTRENLATFDFMHRFEAAYPEPILSEQERLITHRHLTIDGCPTTVVSLERTQSGQSRPGTQVLVDVAHHTVVYDLRGYSLSPTDDVNQEIETVLSSFHIEKVDALPATDVRS